MPFTIRRLRLIAFFTFLLLVAASVAVTFWGLREQQYDALVINLAGRQRMLTQKMALQVLGVQVGADPAYREQLRITEYVYFEPTLKALIAGGEAPYTDETNVTLPPTRNPDILAQLETVHATWNEMDQAIHTVISEEPTSAAFAEAVTTVEGLSEVLLAQMDQAVRMYEADAARKVRRVQTIQIGFLAAAAALLVTAFFLTERWILRPVARLGAAARRIGEGDLTTPVLVTGPGEVRRLAHRFEDMRQSLASSQEALQRWARELDGRVAARTREITTLSAITQAANRHIEIKPLLEEILPLLSETVGASAAWVMLLGERGNFSLGCTHNLPPALEADDCAELRWQLCRCQHKLLAGELTAAANILECERLQRTQGDTRGLRYHATVPLHIGERALGNLNLTTAAERVFTDDELRLLGAVGDQISIAIERAQLYEQIRAQRIEEQATMLELSQALLGENDEQAVVDLAVQVAAKALKVEFAAIALADEDGQHYSGRAAVGWPAEVFRQTQRVPLSALPALEHIIHTQAPVVIPDEARETRFGVPPWVVQMGIVSSLLVPMLVAGEAIGGLVVNSRTARDWSEDEVRLLSLIANNTAQALERARLFASARQRAQELAGLYRLSLDLAGVVDRSEVCRSVTAAAAQAIGAACCLVAEFKREEAEVCGLTPAFGLSDEIARSIQYTVDEEVVAIWDISRTPYLIVPDVGMLPSPLRELGERANARSIIAARMIVDDVPTGILVAANKQAKPFDEEDARLLASYAQQAGLALERSRLFQAERDQLLLAQTLQKVGALLTVQLSPDEVLEKLFDLLAQVVTYDSVSVQMLDEDGHLYLAAGRGFPDPEQARQAVRELSEHVLSRKFAELKPIVIPDTHADSRWVVTPGMAYIRSWVGAPLLIKERLIGLLNVDSRTVNAYDPSVAETVMAFANQAAIAIENARLFEVTRRNAEELKAVSDVLRALNATPDVTEAFPDVVAGLRAITGCERVSLTLTERGDWVSFLALDEPRSELSVGSRIRIRDTSAAADVLAGRPHLTPDLAAELDFPAERALYQAGYRSRINLPLNIGGKIVGSLNLGWFHEAGYDEAHLPLLGQIADAVASAVERGRLFEETRQRAEELGALAELSAALRTADTAEEMMPIFLQKATEAIGGFSGTIFLIETGPGEGAARPQPALVARCFHPPEPELIGLRHKLGEGITGHVAATGEMHISEDLSRDPLIHVLPGEEEQIRSVGSSIALPLRAGERVIGVMHVGLSEKRPFSGEEISLLTAIAEMAGNALHRARTHEELEKSYLQTVLALANAMDARDAYTGEHSQRMARWTVATAQAMGCDQQEIEAIRWAALLHDIGKIGVPDAILQKPGPLTEEEWETMKRHPLIGAEIVAPVEELARVAPLIRAHQEKYDGSGYPDGLRGEEIPLGARILAVVDAYGAITDERVYRKARSHEEAVAELRRCAGTHFDPQVVEAFLSVIGEP